MYVEQIYTGCLAEASYYIESDGEAVVIDPMREPLPYIQKAQERGATIKYVFETHFHADFVSGHLDLAKGTGATIVYGPKAETGFEAKIATDGEIFKVGQVELKVLHTPGHTPESSTYLLIDEAGKEHAVFTGDTLFIGDVGRPDLAVKSDLTREDLAGMLFDSIHGKLMPLDDEVIVYPGHGAGSACGKNLSSETVSTIGAQRRENYALQAETKEEFIKQVTEGILPPPQYFPKNAILNKQGYSELNSVLDAAVNEISMEHFQKMADEVLVLDTRSPQEFAAGHLKGAMFIGLDGSFASWVGTLIQDLNTPIVLVTEPGREKEAVTRMARVGYTGVKGFLRATKTEVESNGMTWEVEEEITPEDLAVLYKEEKSLSIVDVRKPGEFDAEHIEGAHHLPLDFLNTSEDLPENGTRHYVHCKGGYRSLVAISMLKRKGYSNLVNVLGGMDALLNTDIKTTEFVCPSEA